jgi:hypothetical protein
MHAQLIVHCTLYTVHCTGIPVLFPVAGVEIHIHLPEFYLGYGPALDGLRVLIHESYASRWKRTINLNNEFFVSFE